MRGGDYMFAMNKEICKTLIAKKKWKPIYCSLCVNKKRRSECSNWKLVTEQESREYEERVTKFDERQNFCKEEVDSGAISLRSR
jgi:hypothetical protein